MTYRRLKSDINSLEQDISDYEGYFSKVMSDMVDKTKANTRRQVQNAASEARETPIPFITGPSVPVSLKKSNITKLSGKPSRTTNHVLCKEVIGGNNATVEVTVKTKSNNDKCRKRPRCNASVVENDKCTLRNNIPKQSNTSFDPPIPSKLNRNVQYEDKCQKHLPWSQILKDKNIPCIIHKNKSRDESHGVTNGRAVRSRSQKSIPRHTVTSESLSSSMSDDDDSSDVSNEEPVQYCNRSVQCRLPDKQIGLNGQKETPTCTTSSKNSSEYDGGSSTFSIFNPVRTLNFLIKELRGRLQKCEGDDNLHRIVVDMEQALIRIPSEINTEKNINEVPTRDENSKSYRNSFVPLKTAEVSQMKPNNSPKWKLLEQGSSKQAGNSSLPHRRNEPTSRNDELNSIKSTIQPVSSYAKDIPVPSKFKVEQKENELKYATLERICKQLEVALVQQKAEKNSLNEKVISQKKELELVADKEKDFLTTISYLRTNLQNLTKKAEEQAKTITELTANNVQLLEENKTLLPLRDAHSAVTKHLKEVTEENRKIQGELQVLQLEREKFEIFMASKNKEVAKLKQEFRNIQDFASEQMMNLKYLSSKYRSAIEKSNKSNRKDSNFGADSDPEPLVTETDTTVFFKKSQTGGGRGEEKIEEEGVEIHPVCSSPTSSSMEFYPSWQKISRISSNKNTSQHSLTDIALLSTTENSKGKESDSDSDQNRNLSFLRADSPNFKSFLVDSLSENGVETSDSSRTIEPKSCQEIKDQWRGLFNRIKEQAIQGIGVTLPSPPQKYIEISEPSGMSQWSELTDDSVLNSNSNFFSACNMDMYRGKPDFSTSE